MQEFDRERLVIQSLGERAHDLNISCVKALFPRADLSAYPSFIPVAERIREAKEQKSAVIMMMGAHVLRAGVQRYMIDMLEKGQITGIAVNGAAVIHDYEFALIGKTTESVARYVKTGEFGLWRETGAINDIINDAFKKKMGMGEAIGKAISEGDFPHKDVSIFAACHRLNIPITVHVGIGYDIIHEHPNCDGAATGATSYRDFLIFAKEVENLENGVIMNFGSAVMAPEVFLKALSMARNVAGREKRTINKFTTVVCDLRNLGDDVAAEPDKCDPNYYFRPLKTMLVRTVSGGGKSYYIKGDHAATVPALWTSLRTGRAKDGKYKVLDLDVLAEGLRQLKKEGKKIVHCHGCFDLMHPGHIKYLQASKDMGDVLVVTLTRDAYIDKGPGRPVYNEQLRAETLAALECVDYVAINKWPTAEETLRLLRPDIYVKGQEFEKLEDKTGKIQKEYEVVKEIGAELRFTHEIVFSSTKLINTHLRNDT